MLVQNLFEFFINQQTVIIMNKNNIPVLLLTGYLGSGKTTLLNRILSNKKGIKFAVIVNDIGEVNIDARLIEQGGIVGQKDDSLVGLQNGCICCTLKMYLVEQLHDITAMRRFDYIVIEASGICEPAPIAQTICSIPTMDPKYSEGGIPVLDSIVTVVDALRMRDEFANGNDLTKENIGEEDIENLVIQQIEFCNIVLLNKASEVKPNELEHIKQIVRGLQPKAEIIECNYGDVDLDKIINTNMFDFEKVATSATWIDEIEHHHGDEDDDDDDETE
jgi:G3E family GTPase